VETGLSGHVVEIRMPKLSDSMEEATVLAWLKRPGDAVERGEPLVEVETDKATIVYEAETRGVLEAILVADGEAAALGAAIATLRVEQSDAPPAAPQPARNGARARATPVARRLATQLGVDLRALDGTGPGGRIVRADVQAAAGGEADAVLAAAPDVTEVPLTATQRTIAQRMSESRRAIPDFTLEVEIDMGGAARLREDLRAGEHDPLPSYNDLIVRAVALALREFPALNAQYSDGKALRFGRVNVGIAVATDEALLVPTVRDADRKSIFEIAAESRRLAEHARSRSLTAGELGDGTFTVSNLGMFGVRRFQAVVNHPQAAILSVGEVAQRAVVLDDGTIASRLQTAVALSCDHRIVYGADAARFLQRVRHRLEHPTLLVVD